MTDPKRLEAGGISCISGEVSRSELERDAANVQEGRMVKEAVLIRVSGFASSMVIGQIWDVQVSFVVCLTRCYSPRTI